jgi:hypothetical protein
MRLIIIFASEILLVLFLISPLTGEEIPVPLDLQAKLLLKILTFDRNLEKRADSAVVVGIVYNPEDTDSKKVKSEFSKALGKYSDKKVKGLPVSQIGLKYSSWANLLNNIRSYNVSVLYVTSGNSDNLEEILKASRADSVLTVTGVLKYVEEGVSIGIGLKENKPQIMVNLSSAEAEGTDFSSQLLRLAKVIESSGSIDQ